MSSPRSLHNGFDTVQSRPNASQWRASASQSYGQRSLSVPHIQHSSPQQSQAAYLTHDRGHSSISQFPPILPPIPRVASRLDTSTSETRPKTYHGPQEQGQRRSSAEESVERMLSHKLSFDQTAYPQFPPTSATATSVSPALSTLSPVQSSPSQASDVTWSSQPPRLSRRSVTSPDGSFLKPSSTRDSVTSTSSPTSATQPSSYASTLGVPYSSTMAREKPLSGNVPLAPTSTVNGVPQHLSRSQTARPAAQPAVKSKSRLNLLNPVNLLMRRRSNQAVETLTEKSSMTSLIVPPMDLPDGYDPRIKGNKVHDFSAPRPQRNMSYNDAVGSSPPKLEVSFLDDGTSLTPIQQSPPDLSRETSDEWSHTRRPSTQHAPVFTEHFDSPTDDDMARRSSAIQAETLANKDFLARNSWQDDASPSLPPFGRKSQQMDEQQVQAAVTSNGRYSDVPTSASSSSGVSPLDAAHGLGLTMTGQSPVSSESGAHCEPRRFPKDLHVAGTAESSPMIEQEPASSPPQRLSPDASEGGLLTPEYRSSSRFGELRHLPSSASRFSFQIASTDSMAEEKLLEEKHKQRHSGQQTKPANIRDEDEEDDEDDEEDFFDEDAMYDPDEMEGFDEPEVLGGNNVFQNTHNRNASSSAIAAGVAGLHFSDVRSSMSKNTSPPISPQPLQTNFSNTSSQTAAGAAEAALQVSEQAQRSPPFQLASADVPAKPTSPMSPNSFYFDDGMIDDLDHVDDFYGGPHDRDGNVFDEDRFDDPSFLKREPQQPEAAIQGESASQNQLDRSQSTYNVNGYDFLMHNPPNLGTDNFTTDSPYSEASTEQIERNATAVTQSSEPFRHDSHSQRGQNQYDAQNSLSAYHNALAEAAHKAAADGRFTRQTSTATSNSTYSNDRAYEPVEQPHTYTNPAQHPWTAQSNHSSRPSYSGFDFGFRGDPGDGGSIDNHVTFSEVPTDDFGSHFPHDDMDDSYDFDDDDIIAAANAEALAADDSGQYGQDFGFYAKPRPGSADGEADINGGYFGQPGIEIQRQKSLREPNLTPITERSEFSTRNSYVAGHGLGGPWSPMSFGGSAQGLPSPALSTTMQLAYQRGMSPLVRPHHVPEADENMTLAEIRRALHPNAFSGSNSSFNSDYGPGLSSPAVEFAGHRYSPGLPGAGPRPMSGGAASIGPRPVSSSAAGSGPRPGSGGTPGVGYYMPVAHGSNQSLAGTGGVPMAWQRSGESNGSHSYSSSLELPSSPSPMVAPSSATQAVPPQMNQALAFSFFDAGGDNSTSVTSTADADAKYESTNFATPKKPASSQHTPSSPAPSVPNYPQTPTTVRKAPPAAILTPSYTSMVKPTLGSPLKMESYSSAPTFSPSPMTAPAASSGNAESSTSKMMTYSPLTSPKSAGHKRMGSGADSVTYVQEKDAAGTRRWVLERRRTSELGLPELIGREIVEGGRI